MEIVDQHVIINNHLAGPSVSIQDTEFNMNLNLVVYVDNRDNTMYIQTIDSDGNFIENAEVISSEMSLSVYGNGPEWGNCQEGDYVYYAKRIGATDEKAILARKKVSHGPVILGPEEICRVPSGFTEKCGPVLPAFDKMYIKREKPLVIYLEDAVKPGSSNKMIGKLKVFEDNGVSRSSENDLNVGVLAYLGGTATFPIRFVPGIPALIRSKNIESSPEDVEIVYNTTKAPESDHILARYNRQKLLSIGAIKAAFYDRVPTDNKYIFYFIRNDEHDGEVKGIIDIKLINILEDLTIIEESSREIIVDAGESAIKYIVDDEPFTSSEGKPYLSAILGNDIIDNPTDSEIWVISLFIDEAQDIRRVSDTGVDRAMTTSHLRKDPEVVKTNDGLYIYYMEEKSPETLTYSLRRAKTWIF